MKHLFLLSGSILLVAIVFVRLNSYPLHGTGISPCSFFDAGALRTGDIIFRDGRGVISDMFRRCSLRDPRYSHAGIIVREEKKVYVYHVIGGEGRQEGRMRRDLLSEYISRDQARSFAVYRSRLSGTALGQRVKELNRAGICFDSHFDFKSDDKMYCTELVAKILNDVAGHDNFIPLKTVAGISFVACDDIYLSPNLHHILNYQYADQ